MNEFEKYPYLAALLEEYASYGRFSRWQGFTNELNKTLRNLQQRITELEQEKDKAEKKIYELQSDYAELLQEKEQYGRDCFEAAKQFEYIQNESGKGERREETFRTYESYKQTLTPSTQP